MTESKKEKLKKKCDRRKGPLGLNGRGIRTSCEGILYICEKCRSEIFNEKFEQDLKDLKFKEKI